MARLGQLAAFLIVSIALVSCGDSETEIGPSVRPVAAAPLKSLGDGHSRDYQSLSAAEFVRRTRVFNQFVIESSALATRKAADPETQRVLGKLLGDHGRLYAQLRQVLPKAGVAGPPPLLTGDWDRWMHELRRSEGRVFLRKYRAYQIDAHERAAAMFARYADHGGNSTLKAFAARALPQAQAHLQRLQALPDMPRPTASQRAT